MTVETSKNVLPVDADKLVKFLLDQPWHRKCAIEPKYIPKDYRGKKDEDQYAKVVIIYNNETEDKPMLRYSQGPKQGFFWDIFGDDMQCVELAIIALSKAPAPANVGTATFKF